MPMPRSADPRAYFSFVAKMTALLADYSRDDLVSFRELAMKTFPGMATLLGACMDLADDKGLGEVGPDAVAVGAKSRSRDKQPLLDLLCSTELFPANKDLVSFAK